MVRLVCLVLVLAVTLNFQVQDVQGLNLMADLARKLHIGKSFIIAFEHFTGLNQNLRCDPFWSLANSGGC